MNIKEEALKKHYEWQGKIEVVSRAKVENSEDLSLAYTPGVAQPCLEIQKDYEKSFTLTRRWNSVAVVTDGTAVLGLGDIGLCDRFGIVCEGDENLNEDQQKMSLITNKNKEKGTLKDAMRGADLFIGVSVPGVVDAEMIKSMADDLIVFPMANPTPEIFPDEALSAGARVVGTGRSDFPNQINNVLAFPGIFRGALDCRASEINDEMKIAASYAIASLVSDDELSEDYILPKAFDERVGKTVAEAVSKAAKDSGVARI